MDAAQAGTTLRDDIAASFDSVMDQGVTPSSQIGASDPAPSTIGGETESQKTERLRDEAGRFAKGEQAKQEVGSQEKPIAPQTDVAKPRTPRPSSWKKDYDEHWNALDPKLAEYIQQRESEYARGVSTYKHEADSARQLNEAIAPFIPNLQKHGLEPTQWIRNLGTAHERLALGSQQDKIQTAAQLIRDYGIDPQGLFQLLSNPQAITQAQPQQPAPVDYEKIIEQKLTEREIQSEYNRFLSEAPEKYPHYEAVKATMAGLLQSELAQDYPSAYEAALRHPRHADLFEQAQQQRQQQEQAAASAKSQAVVNRARSQAVSVKSSTPSGTMAPANGNKSLRGDIEAAFDAHSTGRV